ncbi:MAG: hypothetical protein WB439_12160 [Acidobacteriaceae bacterium]
MTLSRPLVCGALLALIVASISIVPNSEAQRSTHTAAAAAPVIHLHREERSAPLTDWQTHQSRNFRMMSMLLPTGWQLEVRPGPNFAKIDCADNSGRIMVSATSPDKSTGVLILPISAVTSALSAQKADILRHFPGAYDCRVERPMPLATKLQDGAAHLFPGSHITSSVEAIPGLSDQMSSIVASANQRGVRISAEAGRIRLTGAIQGKPVDMWLVAMQTQRMENGATISDLPLAAVLFAPPGQLDSNDKLLMTLVSSVQIDPEWTRNAQYYVAAIYAKINGAYATVNRIQQQMQQDNANAAAQQQAIRTDTANYRSKVMSQVASNRAAALDHSSQQFALYMGDQAVYKDPSTGQRVQMSNQYDHVWASTTGNTNDYVMTDSASFDPNGKVGSSGWTQLQMEH